ncbi:hypothetical protein CERSUDRAFT_110760 [Gelatoporia subvermispora B]|uniref:Uncharacterized protein n=1 Tax=Ceriporiopsis subvermispora (strain B) TaxID=914234 RepID=M2RUT5_CERS8|nr:hypothetical protein CERSUDRAFT_110760 [Gelatoporia subvermispora B]
MSVEDNVRVAMLSRYTLKWLYSTFDSPATVHEMLRPDLEAGIINYHDYELAAMFLPGSHRHYPKLYAATFGLSLAAFGYLRKPRWSRTRILVASSTAALFGMLQGHVSQVRAMNKFKQQLEDPGAFAKALVHCHQRTGIMEKHRWMLPPGAEQQLSGKNTQADEQAWSVDSQPLAASGSSSVDQRVELPATSPESEDRPRTRWDELRVANARNVASDSSWESLRQIHERQQVSTSQPDDQPEMDERALEQAKFDALLEEERRKAMGSSSSGL